jgi:hypothetical protein
LLLAGEPHDRIRRGLRTTQRCVGRPWLYSWARCATDCCTRARTDQVTGSHGPAMQHGIAVAARWGPGTRRPSRRACGT